MITCDDLQALYTQACAVSVATGETWTCVLARLVNEVGRVEPRREIGRRTFEFCTGDEVDVDKVSSIDANAANSIAHFTLGHGSFLRVRFGSDDERRQQLAAMRAFRGRV